MIKCILKVKSNHDPFDSSFISFKYTLQNTNNDESSSPKSIGYFQKLAVEENTNIDLVILNELQEAITYFKKQL